MHFQAVFRQGIENPVFKTRSLTSWQEQSLCYSPLESYRKKNRGRRGEAINAPHNLKVNTHKVEHYVTSYYSFRQVIYVKFYFNVHYVLFSYTSIFILLPCVKITRSMAVIIYKLRFLQKKTYSTHYNATFLT